MRRLILFLLFFVMIGAVHAQFTYGTTGLLNMPTADMQRDKTSCLAVAFWRNMPLPPVGPTILSTIILTSLFFPGWKYPIFVHCTRPWRLILHMGPGFWVPSTYGKFVNQDRNFCGTFTAVEGRLVETLDPANCIGRE